jgi:hypothetical protein
MSLVGRGPGARRSPRIPMREARSPCAPWGHERRHHRVSHEEGTLAGRGRSERAYADLMQLKLALDLECVERQSFWLDCRILARTRLVSSDELSTRDVPILAPDHREGRSVRSWQRSAPAGSRRTRGSSVFRGRVCRLRWGGTPSRWHPPRRACICPAALDVGPEDEVIVPTMTFCSSRISCFIWASSVTVDVRRLNMRQEPWRPLSHRTRAIMPVHYAGQPCAMEGSHTIATHHVGCRSWRTPPTRSAPR